MSKNLTNIFLIIASAALYFEVISPLYYGTGSIWQPDHGITDLQSKNQTYSDTLTQAGGLINQARGLSTAYMSIPDDAKQKMKMMVPDSIDSVRLVSELSNIAHQSGFVYDDISVTQGSDSNETYGSYRATFSMKTSYVQFKQFMHNLETSMRLFSVQNVSFSLPDKVTGMTTYQVVVDTYYMK